MTKSFTMLIAILMLVSGSHATAQTDSPMAEIELVPHPDLTELKPEVRKTLQPAADYFRQQRATLEGRALGLAYGRMGINYLAHEQQDAAGACLRNAAVLDSGNARWPYLLAVHYEETGSLDKAVESYRDALIKDPQYLPGFVRLGRVLSELDRLDEAEAAFRVVLDLNKDDAAALAGTGQVAFQREDYSRAARLFERALRLQPEASSLHYRLGLTYRALGETDKARDEIERAGERIPTVDDPLLAFVQAHSKGADQYLEAAAKAEEVGQLGAAIRFYEISTSIQPANVDALRRLGELQGITGDSDAALMTFGRILSIEPDNAAANYFAGTVLEQRGDDSQARERYVKALEAEPQLVEPRMLLANSLMRSGAFGEAGEQYAQIAHQLPSSVEVMYLLGMAWLAAGECQWAHPVLLRAVQMAPGDEQALTGLARAYSTCPGVSEEQRAQALTTARAMYERKPNLQTSETLAMACAANGLFEEAVDFQAQAIFEALKQEDNDVLPWMQAVMKRYQAGEPAADPWSLDASVYQPRALSAQPTAPSAGG
jgi:tetratricopeptide (TPR) repeat protein